MKRINNKFRNNNNHNNNYNPAYSLNYKFDSTSIAGKISGTALDLIKRYNDLARDAQSNGDYVNAEIFRQYAEHYRKIVTDINERRNYQPNGNNNNHHRRDGYNGNANAGGNSSVEESVVIGDTVLHNDGQASGEQAVYANPLTSTMTMPEEPAKKEFTVIEIPAAQDNAAGNENEKPKRTYRKKNVAE